MNTLACALSDRLARMAGSVWAVYVAALACAVAWVCSPPVDPFNSAVSDLSLILLFVLQRSGERDTRAIKSGTAEIARALPDADERVMRD